MRQLLAILGLICLPFSAHAQSVPTKAQVLERLNTAHNLIEKDYCPRLSFHALLLIHEDLTEAELADIAVYVMTIANNPQCKQVTQEMRSILIAMDEPLLEWLIARL